MHDVIEISVDSSQAILRHPWNAAIACVTLTVIPTEGPQKVRLALPSSS